MNETERRQLDAGRRARRRGAAGGFTLLEMLTVVIIVGLLLSIGTPAVLRMQLIAMRNASRATVNTIDGGCKQYWNDFEFFPPSAPGDNDGGREGRQNVVQALVGYLGGGDPPAGDRVEGWGFKTSATGKVYVPYNGCEEIKFVDTVFVESFDNEIFYYRWDEGANTYQAGDNSGGPDALNNYARMDGTGKIIRKDFLLMSKGPDGKWANDPTVVANSHGGVLSEALIQRDDVTNITD